ncbi:MAG TPA: hypothetical protein VFG74_05775 [Miltoncostaeaceae bacterium]|nr:hypothetical protein [Miltoncostaeaceae bacterium]
MRHGTPLTRRWAVRAAGALAAALACGAAVALAAPGQPDRGFGDAGRRVLVGDGSDRAAAVAIAPDGRIVVVGDGGPDTALTVTRLLRDGSVDRSFGDGGTHRVDLGGVETGNAVAVAPDGSIVAAGATSVGANVLVLRLTPTGAADAAFGPGGVRVIDYGGPDAANAVALQPDGRVLLAGTGGAGRALLVTRLNPDGTPDMSFDGDGTAGIDLSAGDDAAFGMARLRDGRIMVGGVTGNPSDAAFVRFGANGAVDRTFGIAGTRVLDAGGADAVRALALRPDGKIVAVGAGGPRSQVAVWRLNRGGALDASFGRRGLAGFATVKRAETAEAVALQQDGKIVVAGSIGRDMLVARFQPGGAPDTTFGRGGRRIVQLGGRDAAGGVAVQPDGAIVAAGVTSAGGGDAAVVRLQGDPPRPPARCAGREATIIGTPQRDHLVGTPGRDVIAALAGDDLVQARGGGDIVCGGAGADRLVGGAGADRLLGQAGNDMLDGGPGPDVLRGGPGRDVCSGGPGRDVYACERITGR